MQLLATEDSAPCQKLQITHSLWEFAINGSPCYGGHVWLHVTKQKGFRVIDLNFQGVSGIWCGWVTPLPHPFNHFNHEVIGFGEWRGKGFRRHRLTWPTGQFSPFRTSMGTQVLERLVSYVFDLKDTECFSGNLELLKCVFINRLT